MTEGQHDEQTIVAPHLNMAGDGDSCECESPRHGESVNHLKAAAAAAAAAT